MEQICNFSENAIDLRNLYSKNSMPNHAEPPRLGTVFDEILTSIYLEILSLYFGAPDPLINRS